jgi:hypothetical protein
MERAMKEAEKEMKKEMEKAMREAQKAAPPAPPAQPPAAPATPKPQVATVTPAAPPAPAPQKPASVALAPTLSKPAAAPAMKAEVPPKPAPEAAPSAEGKPKAARRVAERKPAVSEPAAAPVAPVVTTAKYNDVMTAVMYGDRAGAAEAIELGFWVDRPASNGMTALMAAALNGDAAMTQLLLKHGADPNRNVQGGSVLDYARQGGNSKVVELLRQAGAR